MGHYMNCCPLCRDMESPYATRIPYDYNYDEEVANCEVSGDDDD